MLKTDLTSRSLADLGSSAELAEMEWAPCREGCPAHADIRSYVQHIAEGDWRGAIDIIRDRLAFAAVCGRVCHHPCEDNCRRQDVDQQVAIRELKRFVAEFQGAAGATVNKAAKQDKARVAIVGGGPAGMSAGLELAKLGYQPTVFEKAPVPGGMPAQTIPRYRLPLEVTKVDTDWICAHGVEVVTGVEIGKDKTVEQLRSEGFEAVLVATGLSNSRGLPIDGADAPGVHLVIDFLRKINFGPKPVVGEKVLVIGGGNVAIDAARSAVRLGAGSVTAMCLENEEEMPAWPWEQEEARDEGVQIIHRRGPVEVVVSGEKISAVKARKVTQVFNADGQFSPEYDDSDVIDIPCDTVVFAIGQMPDMGFLEGSGLELTDRGRLTFNPATYETNVPGVFACGEIVTPPGSVVEAGQSGKTVAKAIDMYLSGKPIEIPEEKVDLICEIPAEVAEKVIKTERVAIPTDSAEQRAKNFEEFEHTLDADVVVREARRCMSCGGGVEVIVDKCAACLTCLRVCPFDIPEVTDVARISSNKCQFCGLCMAECPANAIVSRSQRQGLLHQQVATALAGLKGEQKAIAFIGGFCRPPAEWRGEVDTLDNVAEIYISSTSRLSVADILDAIVQGASKVIVVSCPEGKDRYPTVADHTQKHVAQLRELIGQIGLPAESVQLIEVADQSRDQIVEAMSQAMETADNEEN